METFEAMSTIFAGTTGFRLRLELNLDETYAHRVDQFRIQLLHATASPLIAKWRVYAELLSMYRWPISAFYPRRALPQWTSFAMLSALNHELSKMLVSGIAGTKTVLPGTQKMLEVEAVRRVEEDLRRKRLRSGIRISAGSKCACGASHGDASSCCSKRSGRPLCFHLESNLQGLDDPRPAFREDRRREYGQYEDNVILPSRNSADNPLQTLRSRLQTEETGAWLYERRPTEETDVRLYERQ